MFWHASTHRTHVVSLKRDVARNKRELQAKQVLPCLAVGTHSMLSVVLWHASTHRPM